MRSTIPKQFTEISTENVDKFRKKNTSFIEKFIVKTISYIELNLILFGKKDDR